MLSLLQATFMEEYGVLIIPVALIVVLVLFNQMRVKKYQKQAEGIIGAIKVGDVVKTYSGFYGQVSKVIDMADGNKALVLATGDSSNIGHITIDIKAVYAIEKGDVSSFTFKENKPTAKKAPAKKTTKK